MSTLSEAFSYQAESCRRLGSAFMGQLCDLLAARLERGTPLTDRLFDWPGDLGPAAESLPLRLCGALHALVLSGDKLASAYPPHAVSDDTLWKAVDEALHTHAETIDRFIDSPPQTNEIRRSVALLAMGHWLTARYDLPIIARELGASGGLNLHWDSYAAETPTGLLGDPEAQVRLTPDWRGAVPQGPRPRITDRRGVDLNPIDPTDPEGRLRLLAYLWPDQPERRHLTEQAIALMRPHEVDRGDAIDWLARECAPVPGATRLIYTTIAWQYFPAEAQARGRGLIEAAGQIATAEAPLAWFGMENDRQSPGAALTLRLWPGDSHHELGRIDFHGRWVDWRAT